VSQIKNLRLKIDDLKQRLGIDSNKHDHTESSEEDSEEEIVEKKAVARKQRKGVSAEVYGQHNKKGDFVPKVFPKADDVKEKLQKRLLQSFLFSALDQQEFNIVIDALEEIRCEPDQVVIQEGD
jgi:cAMP-dependent protein kinase regulator